MAAIKEGRRAAGGGGAPRPQDEIVEELGGRDFGMLRARAGRHRG